MARPSPICRRPSGGCSSICSNGLAATGRWWRSWLWFSSTTKQAVLCAVELALNAGAPTKTHILNLLHRLIDGKSPITSTVEPPQALTLSQEPRANVERYDALRSEETTQEVRHAS